MSLLIVALFILGYVGIALEHTVQVNKAGTALVTGVVLWICYAMFMPEMVEVCSGGKFAEFLASNPSAALLPKAEQYMEFITHVQIIEVLGEISETLFFLIGAMTIVEIIDVYGGFKMLTNRITTHSKRKLLWIISIFAFFMSAVLDNMTTTIIMIVLINRIIPNYKERWLYSSIVVIAANSGGAWSPIGDITTIMLWVKGNVTAPAIISRLILPCIVSSVIPTYIASRFLKGHFEPRNTKKEKSYNVVTRKERILLSAAGLICLVSVPIFKIVTHLPPFMGVLLALGIMWIITEWIYRRKTSVEESLKVRVPNVLKRIDISTILFFLGILLAVSALQHVNILAQVATFLDTSIHNIYATNLVIGVMSSIIDNVPLVAALMSMYPIANEAMIAAAADPAYLATFVQDGQFWEFLTYCAGTGGSLLIIGSAAGVVAMGIEHIPFSWYFKNITLLALSGYLGGAVVYLLQTMLFM